MSFAGSKLSLASATSIVILDMMDSATDAAEHNFAGGEVVEKWVRWAESGRVGTQNIPSRH